MTASGADIWNTADEFHFVDQPLRGDGTITARIATLADPEAYAKAGVMIRQTLDGASTDDFEGVSATQGIVSIHRDTAGADSTNDGGPNEVAPYWVRLVRVGSVITASSSPDGVNWTVSNTVDIPMGANVFVGLAVASHDDTQAVTATFDNVSFVQADYSQGVAVAVASTSPIGSFLADRWGEGGNTATTTAAINTARVTDPAPEAVYQTERYGDFSYDVPDLRPYGLYTVRLDEAEIYYTQAGSRQFDVEINGLTVLSNYDIYAASGGEDIAVDPTFAAQADADGQIFVTFTAGAADAAKVAGLEILPRSAPERRDGRGLRLIHDLRPGRPLQGDGHRQRRQPADADRDGPVLRRRPPGRLGALGTDGTATSAAIADLGAGAHSVTVAYAGDSVFGAATSTAAPLAVAPAPLRIVAANASKVYGAADPAFSVTTAGFVLGQGLANLTGSLVETTAATPASHVGTYAITPAGLSSANYAITFVGGTMTVTPAPLTVTVASATGLVGSPLPAFSAQYVGLVAGTPRRPSTHRSASSPPPRRPARPGPTPSPSPRPPTPTTRSPPTPAS